MAADGAVLLVSEGEGANMSLKPLAWSRLLAGAPGRGSCGLTVPPEGWVGPSD
ncbi:MAG: hypothetical protein RL559_1238, partial [Pseudomonadota bacterium]